MRVQFLFSLTEVVPEMGYDSARYAAKLSAGSVEGFRDLGEGEIAQEQGNQSTGVGCMTKPRVYATRRAIGRIRCHVRVPRVSHV